MLAVFGCYSFYSVFDVPMIISFLHTIYYVSFHPTVEPLLLHLHHMRMCVYVFEHHHNKEELGTLILLYFLVPGIYVKMTGGMNPYNTTYTHHHHHCYQCHRHTQKSVHGTISHQPKKYIRKQKAESEGWENVLLKIVCWSVSV